ncbi:hypothetical protein [Nocardioides sp. ChNu-99]|uniref:hypothetical protein n=1 Tax=Nocardioides sp. ChNu-99 TaxID=2839897 RepID=UPI0024060B50|nr:hypothetical protein [Nocardioides sp. ChNu-99]MDF9717548.1 hypothetical protein [Nocardioides sp. ChNu-99]
MGGTGREGRRERRERVRWEKEMLRRLEALDRLDAHYGLGASPYSPPPPRRGRGGGLTLRGAVPAGIVVALLVVATLAVAPAAAPLRAALGLERYGEGADYEPGQGTYAFAATQDGSEEPVGYDPCVPIRVVVNPEGAPDDHRELVDRAVATIEGATGLDLEVVGETDDREIDDRGLDPAGNPEPALVMWADEDEVGDLASGIVVLDREDLAAIEREPGGTEQRQAIVDHEFAHLVGLGHVDDPTELMHAENTGQTAFGPGDLEGLARLGSIPCG